MKRSLCKLAILGAVTTQLHAATLDEYKIACVGEDLFDQATRAIVTNDVKGLLYLLEHGCIFPKHDVEISVLDTTLTGTAHVRAYVGDSAIELWTSTALTSTVPSIACAIHTALTSSAQASRCAPYKCWLGMPALRRRNGTRTSPRDTFARPSKCSICDEIKCAHLC